MRKQLIRGRIITTIFNGVPLPDVRVDPLVMSKRPLRVIHVTRFVPQKNSEMVLAIAEKLRSMGILNEFHFDIVGDGPGRSALENESRARGLEHRLTFHGSHPSVRQFFLNGFCILSTSRWEGLPIAVLEALALGLPAVASDTPGNSDVVSTSVGRLFPLNDAQAAAVHLSDLRGSLETWEKLSASAVRLVRGQFSVQRMAADTLTVYRQPLSRTRP